MLSKGLFELIQPINLSLLLGLKMIAIQRKLCHYLKYFTRRNCLAPKSSTTKKETLVSTTLQSSDRKNNLPILGQEYERYFWLGPDRSSAPCLATIHAVNSPKSSLNHLNMH